MTLDGPLECDKLYGGYSQSGLVTGNSLTINGGYTGQNSFGVTFTLRGAASVTGDVVGNSLTIKKMLIGSSGLTVGHESLSGRVAENDVVLESVIINKTPTYVLLCGLGARRTQYPHRARHEEPLRR